MMVEVDRVEGERASTPSTPMAKVGCCSYGESRLLPQAAGRRHQMLPQDRREHAKWLKGCEDALDAEDDGMASDFA